MSKASDDVLSERQRQIDAEDWTEEHDDQHTDGSLALAAACYARPLDKQRTEVRGEDYDGSGGRGDCPVWRTEHYTVPKLWPKSWAPSWWKPKNRRRDLVRAAALLIAEIERLDRAASKTANAELRDAAPASGLAPLSNDVLGADAPERN